MSVFTWPLTIDLSADIGFRIKKAGFGDGYTQRAKDGINTRTESWSLLFFADSIAAYRDVCAFLNERAGLPFGWTPPGGAHPAGWYVCETYQPSPKGYDVWTISMTFVKDYQP